MSRTPALVSVVLPALNATPVIDVQLAALAGQDYPGEFEVIVADNGSTDGLARHLSGHPLAERLRLRRVDAGAAPGAAHARNVGVDAARGDFIVFCDADDQAHPQWLRRLVARAADFDAVSGPVETTTLNSARTAEWTPVNAPTSVPRSRTVPGGRQLQPGDVAQHDRQGGTVGRRLPRRR
ncbi:glycosyltransferase family A protein [Prescottella defluvii]|nr:glycosyltransferase family A protein [Prescottella defluvii]